MEADKRNSEISVRVHRHDFKIFCWFFELYHFSRFVLCHNETNISNYVGKRNNSMNLTFQLLKRYFPELNRRVISRERIIKVLSKIGVPVFDIPMLGRGAYVRDISDGSEYVFIKYNLQTLIRHETLAYESVHALCHVKADFLEDKQNLQSEVLSLVMMMPKTDLPRLNRIKHQLDDESYELLMRRNRAAEVWKI